jgi:proteasome assembly chaperone 2
VQAIFKFVQEAKFSTLLFLTGVSPIDRTDMQMLYVLLFVNTIGLNVLKACSTPTFHLISAGEPAIEKTRLKALRELSIPVYSSPVMAKPNDLYASIPFVPGGGLTRRILASLPADLTATTATLFRFVMEGDNRADAQCLAVATAESLSIRDVIKEWNQPSSWQLGLFGSQPDQQLYG